MYKIFINPVNNNENIIKIDENVWLSKDENNSYYKEYLVWISEGNIPENISSMEEV
jgi:hypothetical protein